MCQQNEQTSQVLSTLFPFTMSLLCLVSSMYIDVKQTQSQTKHRIHYVDCVTYSVCVDEKKKQNPTYNQLLTQITIILLTNSTIFNEGSIIF